ncbi:hypothetical protein RhiirC2_776440 [Rhizophagus irregularis]|uniref:Uncharacterized protein n=1 Tax=Rhizophagus irregularis TaxID=588596 RepID=A0A2N1NGP2_9GLOM|nr:hypothetical protein RhiirC2_776440 [Rhizophagus irregularis]
MEDLWMMRPKNNNGNEELKNNGEDNGKKLEALADGRNNEGADNGNKTSF